MIDNVPALKYEGSKTQGTIPYITSSEHNSSHKKEKARDLQGFPEPPLPHIISPVVLVSTNLIPLD